MIFPPLEEGCTLKKPGNPGERNELLASFLQKLALIFVALNSLRCKTKISGEKYHHLRTVYFWKKRGFKKDDEGCSSSFPVLWIEVINSARNFKEETSFARLSVAGRGITPSYNTFENKLFHSLQSQPVLPLKSCCSYCC